MSDTHENYKTITEAEYDALYEDKSNVVQIDYDFNPDDCVEAFQEVLEAMGIKTTYILVGDLPSIFVEIGIPGRRSE